MRVVRFFVACLSALACLGASYAVAGGPIPPGKATKAGATLKVQICAGVVSPTQCGPKVARVKGLARGQARTAFPPIAKQAGSVTVPRLNITCPDACEATAARPMTVTIKAWPRRDGYHEFHHWEGGCDRAGTVATCTLPIGIGVTTVTAVITSN
jgi:hypothetical protein